MFYVYARVSTKEQYHGGHSIDWQVTACLDYARAHGLPLGTETNCDVPGVFIDGGKSAYKKRLEQRPGGRAMMGHLLPGCGVITYSPHRLFRRLSDAVKTIEDWRSVGVGIHCIEYHLRTDTPDGLLMLHFLTAVAQWKAEIIGRRTLEAVALRKQLGITTPMHCRKTPPNICRGADLPSDLVKAVLEDMRDGDKTQLSTGRLLLYTRVSTKDQTVDSQRDILRRAIDRDPLMKDREVLWFEDEGTSAYAVPLFKRPAGGRMKAAMTEGDTIVVVRPDRLFRSLKDMAVTMERLSKEKVHVLFAESRMRTDTPTGRLMVSMLSMVAEMESREIGRMSQMGRITSALGDPLKANRVLPSVLNPRPSTESRSRYKFHGVISAEDWRDFHFAYLDAVESNEFGQNEVASSILFNRVLKKYGLPPVAPGDRTLVRAYRGRLKAVPRNEHVEKVLADLKKFKPTGTVSDPIHADRPKRCRLQIKRVRGVMEKMRLSSPAAVILAMGGDPVAAERLVTSLR